MGYIIQEEYNDNWQTQSEQYYNGFRGATELWDFVPGGIELVQKQSIGIKGL